MMNDPPMQSVDKRKSVSIKKACVLGTYSFMFTQAEISKLKLQKDGATHRWTCILRAPNLEDQSYYIKKVVFNLHQSFNNPQKVVERPPYLVVESGWGEFEIVAKIYFVDPHEKPVELKHCLKLYPPGTLDIRYVTPPVDHIEQTCVVSETYDEIIFNNPGPGFYGTLVSGPVNPPITYALQEHFLQHDPLPLLNQVTSAEAQVDKHIVDSKAELAQIAQEVELIKEQYYLVAKEDVEGGSTQQDIDRILPDANADSRKLI